MQGALTLSEWRQGLPEGVHAGRFPTGTGTTPCVPDSVWGTSAHFKGQGGRTGCGKKDLHLLLMHLQATGLHWTLAAPDTGLEERNEDRRAAPPCPCWPVSTRIYWLDLIAHTAKKEAINSI